MSPGLPLIELLPLWVRPPEKRTKETLTPLGCMTMRQTEESVHRVHPARGTLSAAAFILAPPPGWGSELWWCRLSTGQRGSVVPLWTTDPGVSDTQICCIPVINTLLFYLAMFLSNNKALFKKHFHSYIINAVLEPRGNYVFKMVPLS